MSTNVFEKHFCKKKAASRATKLINLGTWTIYNNTNIWWLHFDIIIDRTQISI